MALCHQWKGYDSVPNLKIFEVHVISSKILKVSQITVSPIYGPLISFHYPLSGSPDCNSGWQVVQEEAPQSQGGLLNIDDLQIGKAIVPRSGS